VLINALNAANNPTHATSQLAKDASSAVHEHNVVNVWIRHWFRYSDDYWSCKGLPRDKEMCAIIMELFLGKWSNCGKADMFSFSWNKFNWCSMELTD